MARKFPPNVWTEINIAGLGDITFGSVPDSRMQTPIEAGLVDGDEPGYRIEQGADWEEGIGTIQTGATEMARTTVTRSFKSGVFGDDLIEVGSGATVRLIWDSDSAQQVWDNLGRFAKVADVIYTNDYTFVVGEGAGKMHTFNKATAVTATLPELITTIDDAFLFRNMGAGTLTLDAFASEQIENATTFDIPQGFTALVTVNATKDMWRVAVMGANLTELYLTKAAQTLTVPEQSQILVNLGLSGARDNYKNRFVNPAAQASQENGNTASGVDNYYVADQWRVLRTTSAGVISSQRVQVNTPKGSGDRMRISVTTADASLAAGELLGISQEIEGHKLNDMLWGTANAVPATITFGFKGPAGTYAAYILALGGSGVIVLPFTVSAPNANTDQYYTLAVPGPTIGSFPTGGNYAARIGITLACGTTGQIASTGVWSGTVPLSNAYGHASLSNGLGANTNVFEIFDLQFHADPSGTGIAPSWELPDFGANMIECYRFWQTFNSVFRGMITNAQLYDSFTQIAIPMRTTPTLSGTHVGHSGFNTSVGTLTMGTGDKSFTERRTATGTQTGTFASTIVATAR